MKWSKEKVNNQKTYFSKQRKEPTGNFTEFVVRTYYFLYKMCSETENKMVRSNVTYRKELIDFVYRGIYNEPDHMAQSVIDDCITNLKEMAYIGFKKVSDKWMIYIKSNLDFLLLGEHEKYLETLNITNDFMTESDLPCVDKTENNNNLKIYRYKKKCYKCGNETDILTYITYSDNLSESMVYPWDKSRALKGQDILAHLSDPSIEYYGINVIGDIESFDKKMLALYPEQIAIRYSNITKTKYPMNICSHCGAIQGRYYVYRDINTYITQMKQLELFAEFNKL